MKLAGGVCSVNLRGGKTVGLRASRDVIAIFIVFGRSTLCNTSDSVCIPLLTNGKSNWARNAPFHGSSLRILFIVSALSIVFAKQSTAFGANQRSIFAHLHAYLLGCCLTFRANDLGSFTGQKLQSVEE